MSTVVESSPEVFEPVAVAPTISRRPRQRPLRLRIHSVTRWLHIYTSMISLIAVLFFSLTGVTLNHPDWLGGETTKTSTGHLPANWKSGTTVDWLNVAEYLRNTAGVRGHVAERNVDQNEASITFKSPGYSADCFVDMQTGDYRLTVAYQGAIGVLNDLHRGRDAGTAWISLIDVVGIFLALVSLTGLVLLVYLKKIRRSALIVMGVGAASMIAVGMLLH